MITDHLNCRFEIQIMDSESDVIFISSSPISIVPLALLLRRTKCFEFIKFFIANLNHLKIYEKGIVDSGRLEYLSPLPPRTIQLNI